MNSFSKELIESSLFLTPSTTMDIVLQAIQEVIPYELAVILSKEDGNNLKVRYSKGDLKSDSLNNYEISLSSRPDIEKVLELGDVKLVDESEHKNHLDTYDGLIDLPAGHSCMLAPLILNGKPFGLMTLDHRQCDIFTPQRVHIAQTLSKLIALALAQALENDKLINENETLVYERNALIPELDQVIDGLIGRSRSWFQVIEKIKLVAPTDSHVMILGETGTGKEKAARAIHTLSSRSSMPFIALNCSALNLNLAESELFGHEKGSFTGASSMRRGRFELADHGTLFLDEVGDLPLEIQPKLLRAIQEGTFERVGGEKTISASVRIICATNLNLEERVKEGKFREDLFYRLNVFPITLPPLRNRKDDLVLLVNHFLLEMVKKFGVDVIKIDNAAIDKLKNHSWPGNVRELQNTLERAAILSAGKMIQHNHIVFEEVKDFHEDCGDDKNIGSFENEIKKVISKALKQSNGKIYGQNGAANLLKMKPTTLQSKIKRYNL